MKKAIWIILGCLLAALYLYPAGQILFSATKELPQEIQTKPLNTEVLDLDVDHSAILQYSRSYEVGQIRNDSFPSVITGGAPGEAPSIPDPRIRTTNSRDRDSFSWITTVVYFPMIIVAGGGTILFGILAILIAIFGVVYLYATFKRWGILLSAVLIGILIAAVWFITVYPSVFRSILSEKQPLVWEESSISSYINGGFSVHVDSPKYRSRVVIVNGTEKNIMIYADGMFISNIKAHSYRKYLQLREISRLTSIDDTAGIILDDIVFDIPYYGEPYFFVDNENEILFYNVQSADKISIASPPSYH
jgi:hypothetical protein